MRSQQGQALAEYAMMLGLLLMFMVLVRAIGLNIVSTLVWVGGTVLR